MRILVLGVRKQGSVLVKDLIESYEVRARAITAMARTTSYPCSIVTQMIARGDIKEKGVVHAGEIGWNPPLAKSFLSKLKKRNIHIHETVRILAHFRQR